MENPGSLDISSNDRDELLKKFVRWQGLTIVQFGYLNNLILGLAVGSLVFVLNQLIVHTIESCFAIVFLFLSILLFFFSLMCGIYLGYNRLIDFRKTTQKIKARLNDDKSLHTQLDLITNSLGQLSWNLLRTQLITFSIAELLFIISEIIVIKIFN